MMKLYSGDLSPYSARVRMQIYAKGITDITLERPMTFGTPQFRKDHPIGRIPGLDIGISCSRRSRLSRLWQIG